MTSSEEHLTLPISPADLGEKLVERETTITNAHGPDEFSILITMVIPSPTSTVTVDTTLVRTTFVTVTTDFARPHPTTCRDPRLPQCGGILPPRNSHSGLTSLPSIAEPSSSSLSSSTSSIIKTHETQHASPSGSSSEIGKTSSLSSRQKHAIIGGLSGSIAGLLLIGALIFFLLRRRHTQKAESIASSEKGFRSPLSRNWSQVTSNNTVSRPTPPLSRQSSLADYNGSVIRVSLGGFARPFAHSKSWRESVGAGKLMVMNPDNASESNAPVRRGSEESGNTYFKRQRSAVTAAFLSGSRSRANSTTPSQRPQQQIPGITVDPALSSETLSRPTAATTPSFRSYPSIRSMRTVQQQPPEDPFLTPPDESLELNQPSPTPKLQRPSLAVIQNVASSATRSLSYFGQALNPFRSKSQTIDDGDTASRQSTMTFSSNGDPFKLDKPSVAESTFASAHSPRRAEPAHIPSWRLYEGT